MQPPSRTFNRAFHSWCVDGSLLISRTERRGARVAFH